MKETIKNKIGKPQQLNLFVSDENKINAKANDEYMIFTPGKRLFIENTPDDIDNECHFNRDIWSFPVNGEIYSLKWNQFSISGRLIEIFKTFLFIRLQSKSPSTVIKDFSCLRVIDSIKGLRDLPWGSIDIIELLNLIQREQYYSIKFFYEWCLKRSIKGFTKDGWLLISEFRMKKRFMYETVHLRQLTLISDKIFLVLEQLNKVNTDNELRNLSFIDLQKRVIIRLCLELAPRPSQIYFLNVDDIKTFNGPNYRYYSIELPMAKKVSEKVKEKRLRSISNTLGKELDLLKEKMSTLFSDENLALFRSTETNARYSSSQISNLIKEYFEFVGLNATDLRHNLAQGLADQGASADVIADILGHNSTLPARAYIAATSKISEIKSKALGKNNNYRNIMQMLNTGQIINKNDVQKGTWVKGMAGFQYIGEIGACGLDSPCPKNPVYSCYSCKKFSPFNDGEHAKVLKGLEDSVQLFLDSSTEKKDIQHNRTVVQLEATIEAVKKVIERISLNK